MTNPNVHELPHHYEPVTGHDDFVDTMHVSKADVEALRPDARQIQAARVAGLKALAESGVAYVRPVEIQQIESEALINVRTTKPN
jgi:hypothetical protein